MSSTFDRVRESIIRFWKELEEEDPDLGPVEPDKVTMDCRLRKDLGFHSLHLVELAMLVEDEFGIEISEEAVQNITTVGDAVRFIESVLPKTT